MRKKMQWNWEMLDPQTARAQVIGGWIVNHNFTKNKVQCESMVFIADRDHEWIIVAPLVEAQAKPVKASEGY